MKFTSENGVEFDDELLDAPLLNQYIQQKELQGMRVFVATWRDGKQEYVVFDTKKSIPLKSGTQIDAIGVWLDMVKLLESDS